MARSYSQDLRERVLNEALGGGSARGTAARFGLGAATAITWVSRARDTGERTARRQGHPVGSKLDDEADDRLELIDQTPDLTLDEIKARLKHERGLEAGTTTIWRFFNARHITFKKSAHAAEQDRPDVAEAREAWFEGQLDLDPERLVFIDETGASTKLARLYGRCARGERLRAGLPHGHWKTTTFVAGLRVSGLTAPFVIDGPMTGPWFLASVEQVLCPTLRAGEIVIMDRLAAHKSAAVRAAIEACGAELLLLPAYSPDFNPIEYVFSKLKALLRKAAARSKAALWQVLGALLDAFSPEECANYFAAAGYDPD